MEQNELEEFLTDVKKFNENINNTDIPSEEKKSVENISFKNPLENVEQAENDTEIKSEPKNQSEQSLEELKDGIKKIIDGYAVVKLVDSVFPKTLIYLLSFIDKDFRKINLKNVQLDEEEIEIYKPLGDYVVDYIITKINPLVLLCGMYVYRTTLAITIEYNKVKSMSNHIKQKPMPLKKSKHEIEMRKRKLMREISELHKVRDINRYDREYTKEINTEIQKRDAEIERLNKAIEDLKKEFLISKKTEIPITKEEKPVNEPIQKPEKIDKRKIVDEEKKKVLKERLAKAREIRKQKLQEQKNEANDIKNTETEL
jgi:hypothetical protein